MGLALPPLPPLFRRRELLLALAGLVGLLALFNTLTSAMTGTLYQAPQPLQSLFIGADTGEASKKRGDHGAVEMRAEAPPEETVGKESVWFYVYSGPEFDWLKNCSSHPGFDVFRSHKHASDIAFVEQVQHHRWRVEDPEKADIFVIPVVLSFAARTGSCGSLPFRTMLEHTANAVARSRYFIARPHAHLVLATDWMVPRTLNRVAPPVFRDLLASVVFATQIHTWSRYYRLSNLRFGCTITVPMMPGVDMELGTAVRAQSAAEFGDRRDIEIFFQGQADNRRPYWLRRALGAGALQWTTQHHNPGRRIVFINTSGESGLRLPQCDCQPDNPKLCVWCTEEASQEAFAERLSHAKFSLHVRGDLPGSNRLYGLVAFGAIPVVVSDDAFSSGSMPFESAVPWKDMTVRVSEKAAKEWANVEAAVAGVSQADVERMRALLNKHAPDVLWTLPGNRVVENLMREAVSAKCDTRHAKPDRLAKHRR